MTRTEIETPRGVARAELHRASEARAGLLLGHGAGGGIEAGEVSVSTSVTVVWELVH